MNDIFYKFDLERVQNIVGKRENANNQHFLYPQCFQKASFLELFGKGIGEVDNINDYRAKAILTNFPEIS